MKKGDKKNTIEIGEEEEEEEMKLWSFQLKGF